ncbi:MAG: tetratricopeptide repeat protein [Planctomycetes bacterium]|nr:tetratricopeptide repeat protein [Planctomycetota bacterium]
MKSLAFVLTALALGACTSTPAVPEELNSAPENSGEETAQTNESEANSRDAQVAPAVTPEERWIPEPAISKEEFDRKYRDQHTQQGMPLPEKIEIDCKWEMLRADVAFTAFEIRREDYLAEAAVMRASEAIDLERRDAVERGTNRDREFVAHLYVRRANYKTGYWQAKNYPYPSEIFDNIVEDFRLAAEIDPFNPEPSWHLGQIYLAVNEYSLAVREFEAFLADSPDEVDAWVLLAEAYIGLQEPTHMRRAERLLQDALAYKSNDPDVIRKLAKSKEFLEKFQEALSLYTKLVFLGEFDDSERCKAYVDRANCRLHMWDHGANAELGFALEDARKAIDLDDANYGATYVLAMLFVALGREGEAMPYFDKTIELNPDHYMARVNRGLRLYQAFGKYAPAFDDLDHAWRTMKPGARDDVLEVNLAELEQRLGRTRGEQGSIR